MISFKVVYLSLYWSDMLASGLDVPADRWRMAVEHFGSQADALQYAILRAHATKQAYRVVEVTERAVITIDPANPDMG